jgi:transposase
MTVAKRDGRTGMAASLGGDTPAITARSLRHATPPQMAKVELMAKTHPPYAPEFRRQMIELVRAGRDPADLAGEFEPSSQAIRNWVAQADRQDGRREAKPAADAGLSAAEREELSRLRRENKQLRLERDILSRATAWFARETGVIPSGSSGS